MTRRREKKRMNKRGLNSKCVWGLVLLGAGMAGCSGGSAGTGTAVTPGLSPAPTPTALNTYVGAQPPGGFWEGVYGMALDSQTKYFTFTDQNYYGLQTGGAKIVGNFQNTNGFLKLNVTDSNTPLTGTTVNTQPYILEFPGNGALLDTSGANAPTVFAESSGCPAFGGAVAFQFIQLGGLTGSDPTQQGYGRVKVSTSQSAWTFSGFDLFGIDGTDQKPAALSDGVCAQSAEGYVTTSPTTINKTSVVYTTAIGAGGFFIMDRDVASNQSPLVGMLVPTAPLNTVALAAATYLGFEYDSFGKTPQTAHTDVVTQPVQFAGGTGGGTKIVGGVFPQGDATQTPLSNLTLDMGTQDPGNNGLYPSVVATLPDPTQACVGRAYGGTDSSGNATCIFPGVAVADNPGGKYALFVTINNPIDSRGSSTIQFLLYQK